MIDNQLYGMLYINVRTLFQNMMDKETMLLVGKHEHSTRQKHYRMQ